MDLLKSILSNIHFFSLWIVIFATVLLLGRGQSPLKFVDKKRFLTELDLVKNKLAETKNSFHKKFFLYCDKYFGIFFLYRCDLIFYWVVCGGGFIYLITDILLRIL